MSRFDALSSRLGFAAAAVNQRPDQLDLQKIEDVALAIERMVPAQQDRLIDIAQHGTDALFSETATVRHLVNDLRRERVERRGGQFFEAFLNPDDVMRGLRWFRVKRGLTKLGADGRRDLEAAIASNDVDATSTFLDRIGLGTEKAEWITRVARAFPKDGVGVVGVRGKPVAQIAGLEAALEKTLDALAEGRGDPDELHARAADAFAGLMNAAVMLGRREQSKRPNLRAWFDLLAEHAVTGFLPEHRTDAVEVALVGGSIATEHRFTPEMQIVGLMLQLGPSGGGLDYVAPSGETIVPVGNDEAHLGRPGAPLGIVADGYVFVPRAVEADIYAKTMGDFERKLGFGELPDGRFRIHTRHLGYALRLPLSVEVGGARFSLRHGRYETTAKGASVTPGRPITLSANGATKRIDPATGEVEG
jgi:hypothetical protein